MTEWLVGIGGANGGGLAKQMVFEDAERGCTHHFRERRFDAGIYGKSASGRPEVWSGPRQSTAGCGTNAGQPRPIAKSARPTSAGRALGMLILEKRIGSPIQFILLRSSQIKKPGLRRQI